MKKVFRILALASVVVFASCNSDTSLQQYFVDHQNDNEFIAVDIPSSLLDKDGIELSKDEQEALESIKKVNFLALPLKEGTKARFEKESADIAKILNTDKYETLMKFGSNGTNAVLKYQGEDNDIDEVIVFATDQKKGLALVRVLGDNMRPEKMVKLMKSVEKGNIDMEAFRKIGETIDID